MKSSMHKNKFCGAIDAGEIRMERMAGRAACNHFDRVALRLRAYVADTQDNSRREAGPETAWHPPFAEARPSPQPESSGIAEPGNIRQATPSDAEITRITRDVAERVRQNLADDLAGPLAALRADFDAWQARNEPRARHLDARLEAIREQIAAISHAPASEKASMEALISPIDERLDRITSAVEQAAQTQARHLEAIGAAVEHLRTDAPAAVLIEALRADLRLLVERLPEQFEGSGAPLADMLAYAARELSERLEALRADAMREIARLAKDAQAPGEVHAGADGPVGELAAALTRSIEDIRALQIDGARRTSDGLDLLRRTLADLSTRLRSIEDELAREASPPRPPAHRLGPFGSAERPRTAERTAPAFPRTEPARAFSSEVDTGSREDPKGRDSEYAMKQRGRAFPRFEETRKSSSEAAATSAPAGISSPTVACATFAHDAPAAADPDGTGEAAPEPPASVFVAGATIDSDDIKGRFIAAARRASAHQPPPAPAPSGTAATAETASAMTTPGTPDTSEAAAARHRAPASPAAEEASAFGRLRRSFGRRRGALLGIGGLALTAGVPAGLSGWDFAGAEAGPAATAAAGSKAAVQGTARTAGPAEDFEAQVAAGRAGKGELKLAAALLTRAADLGVVPAMYRLGRLYEKGLGVGRDRAAAKGWYEQAALRGHVKAMHNLAVLLADPSDGRPDYAAASAWFRKAAAHGLNDSQFNLAVLLARGLGTGSSPVEAHAWFTILATQGDKEAAQRRDEIGRSLTNAELASAEAAARQWRPQPPDPAANDPFPVDARSLSAERLRDWLKPERQAGPRA